MDYLEAAMRMMGREGSSQAARNVTNAHAVTGTAMSDSDGGTVLVDLGGDVTTGDGSQWVEVQTDAHVMEGDLVDVLLVGESGRGMSPVVYGVPGGGDRMAAQVGNAETLATEAQAVAQATGQHFWHSDDGAHVTEATQDDWSDPTSPDYQSGPNSLWNSLGMLFRDGLNNLLAILTSGIAIYDGQGNDAENVLATFAADGINIARGVGWEEDAAAAVDFFDGMANLAVSNEVYHDYDDSLLSVDESATLAIRTNEVPEFYGEGRTDYYGSGGSNVRVYADMLGGYVESGVVLVPDAFAPDGTNIQHFEEPALGIRAYAVADGDPFGTGYDSEYNIIMSAHSATLVDDASGGGSGTFTMTEFVRALTNAKAQDTWTAVTAANWMTMGSGWSIQSSTLTYNPLRKRLVGFLQVRCTSSKSAGNNSLGTVKAGYRPPARAIIDTTTNSAYKIYVDGSGAATIVLGSAASANTDFWFAMDYPVS